MRTFKFIRYGAFSDDLVSAEEIATWSKQFGFPLPSRYTAFMARKNGGSIYPSVFEHQHPQIKPVAAIKEFFDWRMVLKYSRLDRTPDKRSIGPDHLIIGRTTVDDQIVCNPCVISGIDGCGGRAVAGFRVRRFLSAT